MLERLVPCPFSPLPVLLREGTIRVKPSNGLLENGDLEAAYENVEPGQQADNNEKIFRCLMVDLGFTCGKSY